MEAKKRLDGDFIKKLCKYKPFRPKAEEFEKYQTINFIEKNIAAINHEEVEAYSQTLGKLFKWLQTAIKTRKEDIIRRKAAYVKA